MRGVFEVAGAAGVVEEVAVGRWAFTHALFRESLYEQLSPHDRAIGHRRAAEALEGVAGADGASVSPSWRTTGTSRWTWATGRRCCATSTGRHAAPAPAWRSRRCPAGLGATAGGDAGAVLDARAKAAYKQRVLELREEIEEATANGDAGRLERAEDEMDFLLAELSAAVGLGGRDRKAASDAEKARQSVTRAVRGAIDRVAEAHPPLGEHLRTTVRTGVYALYAPDPRVPIEWSVSTR